MTTATANRIISEAHRQGFIPTGGRYIPTADPALVVVNLWDDTGHGCVELVSVTELVPLGIEFPFLAA